MGFLKLVVQVFFFCVLSCRGWSVRGGRGCGSRGVGAPMVWAGRVGKGGAPRRTPTQKKLGFEGWGPEGWGPEISRFFSLSHRKMRSVLPSLGGLLVEFWRCLKRQGPQMYTFRVLWLSCEAPAAPKPPGCHTRAFSSIGGRPRFGTKSSTSPRRSARSRGVAVGRHQGPGNTHWECSTHSGRG